MDVIMEVWNWVSTNWTIVLEIVGFFALVATMTPNQTDDEIMNHVMKAINFLGANLGKAANDPEK